jgi:hypothetical protein
LRGRKHHADPLPQLPNLSPDHNPNQARRPNNTGNEV